MHQMAEDNFPDRKLNRLPEYDYSNPGLYFVTLCIHQRKQILSHIDDGQVKVFLAGKICQKQWFELPNRFRDIVVDEVVIMPNHIHAIVYIPPENSSFSLSEVIGSYKSLVAREYYDICNLSNISPVGKFWQRSFHDHIIRNEREYVAIKEYIRLNPTNWDQDSENQP